MIFFHDRLWQTTELSLFFLLTLFILSNLRCLSLLLFQYHSNTCRIFSQYLHKRTKKKKSAIKYSQKFTFQEMLSPYRILRKIALNSFFSVCTCRARKSAHRLLYIVFFSRRCCDIYLRNIFFSFLAKSSISSM